MGIDGEITASTTVRSRPKLRRNLRLWQVLALSVGLMAPSEAISINPQGAVGTAGRAIPLTFVIGMVAALLVAYSFSRLSRYFSYSGSVLGLVGKTLGPRAGVFAAWALAATYVTYAFAAAMAVGLFAQTLLSTWGWLSGTAAWIPYFIAAVALVVALILASTPAKSATNIILGSEGVTIAMILIAAAVVLVKLAGHTAPHHLSLSGDVFIPARGMTVSGLALGVVFAVLSFAGFEGAAALGDEAERPRKDIPRAIFGTCLAIGVFYVAVSAIEVLGFGTSAAGLKQFSQSPALLGTLGAAYVSPWFGDLIIIGTIISAFGACLACIFGASRIVFSLSRDGLGEDAAVARVSPRFGAPVAAVGLVTGVCLICLPLFKWVIHAAPLQAFIDMAYIGTLVLMFAYAMASIGALVFLHGRGEHKVPAWEAIIPVLGVAVIGYVFYKNIVPWPTSASGERYIPLVAGILLLTGLAGCLGLGPATRRIGQRLTAREVAEPRS